MPTTTLPTDDAVDFAKTLCGLLDIDIPERPSREAIGKIIREHAMPLIQALEQPRRVRAAELNDLCQFLMANILYVKAMGRYDGSQVARLVAAAYPHIRTI